MRVDKHIWDPITYDPDPYSRIHLDSVSTFWGSLIPWLPHPTCKMRSSRAVGSVKQIIGAFGSISEFQVAQSHAGRHGLMRS